MQELAAKLGYEYELCLDEFDVAPSRNPIVWAYENKCGINPWLAVCLLSKH